MFIGFDLLLVGGFIFNKIKEHRDLKIEKSGITYTASFVSYYSNTKHNGVEKYSITYTWQDRNNVTHTNTTKQCYSKQEADLVKNAKTFEIKAIENKSIILDLYNSINKKLKENTNKNKKNTITCIYCSTVFNKTQTRCPSCGAPSKIEE